MASLSLDDTPSILKLMRIKGPDGLSVIDTIAAGKYNMFGMCLLNDENGIKIQLITKEMDNSKATDAILKQWLTGTIPDTNPYPRTYRHLLDCLKEADMGVLAQHIEATMIKKDPPSSATPSSLSAPPPSATPSSSSAPDTRLTMSDMGTILNAIGLFEDWERLGMNLGVSPKRLKVFKSQERGEISKCTSEMISSWLKWQDNVQTIGLPSWKGLLDTIRPLDPELAADIESKAPWRKP